MVAKQPLFTGCVELEMYSHDGQALTNPIVLKTNKQTNK